MLKNKGFGEAGGVNWELKMSGDACDVILVGVRYEMVPLFLRIWTECVY